ncbi:uncharacterized protein LOC111270581 isoform X1 [Varroa jacobsoni]|uniref:uncharacterized protein LOC111270581 isoform X1 n=1 Tax=Varroa jacobsoni TaxID=62625 RepID=UPI000BF801FF|nr:uncharacterized protein LOC111270581 isoform X1 [Varroa jacobsoni]
MKWLRVTVVLLMLLASVVPVRNAHQERKHVWHWIEADLSTKTKTSRAIESLGGPTTETSQSFTTTPIPTEERGVTRHHWGQPCTTACNLTLGEICDQSLRICACPTYTFRSRKTGHCKAQIAVYIQLNSADFVAPFNDILERSENIVEVSPHVLFENQNGKASTTIFVDAAEFSNSWADDERNLQSLLDSSEYKNILNLTVARNPCDSPKTRPCSSNALCITNRYRYQVECLCRFGYEDLSTGSGRICARKRRCLNGGLPYLLQDNFGIEQLHCRCMLWFAGENCELDLVKVGLTGLTIIWFVVLAVWSHLPRFRTLFHGSLHSSSSEVSISIISEISGSPQAS